MNIIYTILHVHVQYSIHVLYVHVHVQYSIHVLYVHVHVHIIHVYTRGLSHLL